MKTDEPTDPELRRLSEMGGRRGFVTYREVAEALGRAEPVEGLAGAWLEALSSARVELVDDEAPPGGSPPKARPAPARPARAETRAADEPQEGRDVLRQYFRSIGTTPLLTREGEVEIFERIERGEERVAAGLVRRDRSAKSANGGRRAEARAQASAREAAAEIAAGRAEVDRAKGEIIEANLRLVIAAAKRYSNQGVGLLDLIQEGNIGLMKATDRFKYRLGFKFSTYATWWVRQSITRAIADQARTIRVPIHVAERARKASLARRFLTGALGREPTDAEVGDALGTTAEKVQEVSEQLRDTVSLETPVGDDGDGSLLDLLADRGATSPQDAAVAQDLGERTRALLQTLTPREEQVLRLRYGIGGGPSHTLEELGQRFDLTRERIRQIEARALATLRRRSRSEPLRSLLEG